MTALIPARWREHVSQSTDSPSRRDNISEERELSELQGVANFIQEMARKLSLPLICINTAIVYTQRFYLYHSLATFEKHCLGVSALFLAAKVEDHPRKVEHVYQIAKLLGRVNKEVKDADYIDDVLFNENIILQTLGFEISIEHPHTHVVRLCEMFGMSKNFSQTAYILATYCLQLTRMCLFHKPGIVACLCIRMTCKMTKESPRTRDGKSWFLFGDPTLTDVVLEALCEEFQTVLNTCPPQWKNKTLLNNHQNLANRMVFSPTGLPMVSDTASPSDSEVSNSAISSTNRPERFEHASSRTPKSLSATPQTYHRFSELPSLSSPDKKSNATHFVPIETPERKHSAPSHSNFSQNSKTERKHHVNASSDKKHHSSHPVPKHHNSEKKHTAPKNHHPPHTSDKKPHPQITAPKNYQHSHLPKQHTSQKNHVPVHLSASNNERKPNTPQVFQKYADTKSRIPKELLPPSSSKNVHRSETKSHHQQHHRRHSMKPESSTSSFQRALPKTEQSHPEYSDSNQRKASHSVNQFYPDTESWPSTSLDFSCLSDSYSDFNPWGALVSDEPSPQQHPIPRESSMSSTSSGMNLLKISNSDMSLTRHSNKHVGLTDHYAKRFKPN